MKAQALVSLTIQKAVRFDRPASAVLSVDIDNVGRVDIELTEHEFVHLLGGTNLSVESSWIAEEKISDA